MKLAEKTSVEEVRENLTIHDVPDEPSNTFEVPGWVRGVQSVTQGIGLVVGIILALPFIAISRGIDWYKKLTKREEE